MGVVKYTGPVASFHCPTNAEIRSLKVHFSPKQEGSGDPSPENVRPIVGWDGVEVSQHGKNLYSVDNVIPHTADDEWNGIMSGVKQKFAVNSWPRWIFLAPAIPNATYYWTIAGYEVGFLDKDENVITSKNGWNNSKIVAPSNAAFVYHTWIKNESMTQEQLDAAFKTYDLYCDESPTVFESQNSKKTNYEFGVLGKNKFNWDVPVSESSPVGSDAATARQFMLNTYVIGMSVNNYYRQNYANWVLNPSVENGVISFSSGSANGYGIAFPLKLIAGQTYFLSGTGDGSVGATYYNGDGELISYQNGRLNKTITVPENAVTTLIGFYASSSNTNFTFSNIQLEFGSTATTYEPYDPKHTVYGGWVDLISGEVCEEWKIKDLGECTWIHYGSRDSVFYTRTLNNLKVQSSPDTVMSTHYKYEGAPNVTVMNELTISDSQQLNRGNVNICDPNYSEYTVEQFKEAMNGVMCAYKAVNTTTYQLAPTQLQTFLGQNNVWSNADYVEVEYDLHETQSILARKQYIMANQPHIVKSAAAPLQSFVTDLAAPLKECKVYFEPKQDLHGYDKPWVGGSGKNLLNISSSIVDKTENGVSMHVVRNSNGAMTSIVLNGTATKRTYISLGHYDLKANTILNGCPSDGAYATYTLAVDGTQVAERGSGYTITEDINNGWLMIVIGVNYTCNNLVFKPMIRSASVSDSSFEPYENICPIENWTGCNVTGAGKNLFDKNNGVYSGYYINGNGVFVAGSSEKTVVCKLSAGTYHFSKPVQTVILRAGLFDDMPVGGSASYYLYPVGSNTDLTFTLAKASYFAAFVYNNVGEQNAWQDVLNSIQLEPGSIATSYAPYTGSTLPISWQPIGTNLYSGNDISGTQYVETTVNAIPAGTYTFSAVVTTADTDATSSLVYFYDSSDNIIGFASMLRSQNGSRTMANVTLSDTCTKIGFYAADEWSSGAGDSFKYSDIRLNEDTIETARFPSTIYGGYVDLVNGELVAEWGIVDLGTLTWYTGGSHGQLFFSMNMASKANADGMCAQYKVVKKAVNLMTDGESSLSEPDRYYVYNGGAYPNVTSFKAAMSGVMLAYQLAAPIHYPLTTQNLKTLRGINNIWSTTNGNIELSYWTH